MRFPPSSLVDNSGSERERRKREEKEERKRKGDRWQKERRWSTSRGQKAPPRNFERRLLRPPFNGDSRAREGDPRLCPAGRGSNLCKNRKYFSFRIRAREKLLRIYSDVLALSNFERADFWDITKAWTLSLRFVKEQDERNYKMNIMQINIVRCVLARFHIYVTWCWSSITSASCFFSMECFKSVKFGLTFIAWYVPI